LDCATVLRSARFAYSHTPPSDSRLRAHYLALIIRGRRTFKRSGTLQMEMERGGTQLFFDVFVAMCNHIEDSRRKVPTELLDPTSEAHMRLDAHQPSRMRSPIDSATLFKPISADLSSLTSLRL